MPYPSEHGGIIENIHGQRHVKKCPPNLKNLLVSIPPHLKKINFSSKKLMRWPFSDAGTDEKPGIFYMWPNHIWR
jgi:hypothetical protein